ncbi:MAG TPA: TadE/TadG family type IV pilus assembly protein [Stellaceae bacterium]|nr:TadE/TadG family type IV pilus assembly protein [Stellaceae bacterium]
MTARMRQRRLGAFAANVDGVAAIEFALFAMVFLILLAGTIDLGNALYTEFELDSAVSAGAQVAAISGASVNSTSASTLATSIATTVANANGSGWANVTVVVNNGPSASISGGSTSSGGTATNADNYYCLTGTPANWSWGGSLAQGTACSGGGTAGQFVTITAQRTVTSFFPHFGFVPKGALIQSAAVETQ